MDLSINEGTLVVTGGPGDSCQTAIVIKKTPRGLSAAAAEQLLLAQRFGAANKDWTLKRHDLLQSDSRTYDRYQIVLADGEERAMYFDVTDYLARASVISYS